MCNACGVNSAVRGEPTGRPGTPDSCAAVVIDIGWLEETIIGPAASVCQPCGRGWHVVVKRLVGRQTASQIEQPRDPPGNGPRQPDHRIVRRGLDHHYVNTLLHFAIAHASPASTHCASSRSWFNDFIGPPRKIWRAA